MAAIGLPDWSMCWTNSRAAVSMRSLSAFKAPPGSSTASNSSGCASASVIHIRLKALVPLIVFHALDLGLRRDEHGVSAGLLEREPRERQLHLLDPIGCDDRDSLAFEHQVLHERTSRAGRRRCGARSDEPQERHSGDARDHACEQASSPGDRRDDEGGGERLRRLGEHAARCDDRRSDERRDDRYRQRFEIARGGRWKAPAHVQSERQRPRKVGRHGRADYREPDHFRTKTASAGASAPAVITATVDAPASASTPATAAATTATAMSTGRLTARTTIPTNVAGIARSTP